MKSSMREKYNLLIDKYNIEFAGEVDPDKWPTVFEKKFAEIRRLGLQEFSKYEASINADTALHPWREHTKRRAERIAILAGECRRAGQNEDGWRLKLESEILLRFTIEVACRSCRARLWRSELEPALAGKEQFAESLAQRREKRRTCNCDSPEPGICQLFDFRAGEPIIHDNEITSELPKTSESPDRVYGLRMTSRLRKLLQNSQDQRPSSGGKTIGESIKTTPYRFNGEHLIFPFLALEAKSEKSEDSSSAIELQTAFTIRTLLKLQQDLRDASSEVGRTGESPLVWFLQYRGEVWRVSAAFTEVERDEQTYRVVDLWEGRITSKEQALRLLLVIDHIFDWARDIYRENIIFNLQSLSANDTNSVCNDTEIGSRLESTRHISPERGQFEDIDSNDRETEEDASTTVSQDPWSLLDSPKGAIRDTRYIRSRLMSLYITEDNLSELIQSFPTPEKAQIASQTIFKFLQKGWRVHAEALNELELLWTGKDRENLFISPTKVFLVFVTISAYLTPSWKQTRELSYLAVSEDVVERLMKKTN